MEDVPRFSSCRGVSFEINPRISARHAPVEPTNGEVWQKRFPSFRTLFTKIVPYDEGSASIQRTHSRAGSHFCDLELDDEDDDEYLDYAADLEGQKYSFKLNQIPEDDSAKQTVQKVPSIKAAPVKPTAAHESRMSVILLDQGLFTVYKRLFIVCFVLNLVGLILAATGHFHYAKKEAALFSVGNILALVLCRNEAFLRCVFWFAVKVLGRSWVPLPLKTSTTSVLQCLGGVHSGCGVSSIMWLIFSLVETLRHRETTSDEIIGVASTILGLLVVSSLAAFPLVRHLHHNVFERTHRFAGWAALAMLWVFVILTATYNPTEKTYNARGSTLAKKQEFWFTIIITILIALPWLSVRKVAVKVSAPSNHASLIKFAGGIKSGVRLTFELLLLFNLSLNPVVLKILQ